VFPHAFGEKDLLGDHVLAQFSFLQRFACAILSFSLKGNLTQRFVKIV
jgi:hypothetical protein